MGESNSGLFFSQLSKLFSTYMSFIAGAEFVVKSWRKKMLFRFRASICKRKWISALFLILVTLSFSWIFIFSKSSEIEMKNLKTFLSGPFPIGLGQDDVHLIEYIRTNLLEHPEHDPVKFNVSRVWFNIDATLLWIL